MLIWKCAVGRTEILIRGVGETKNALEMVFDKRLSSYLNHRIDDVLNQEVNLVQPTFLVSLLYQSGPI